MDSKLNVLLLEDNEDDAYLIIRQLEQGGYEVEAERVEKRDDFMAALAAKEWNLIIGDYALPGYSGLDALELAKFHCPETPYIIVSGTIGEETAVAAMRAGAHDYIMKDRLARLLPAIERELREAAVRRDRKHAEELLGESERRFSCLFEQAADAIFVHDFEGRFLLVNRSACESLGYRKEELLRLSVGDIDASQDSQSYGKEFWSRLNIEGSMIFESGHRRKDGGEFPVEIRLGLVVIDQAEHVLAIARNITERKEAEKQLHDYRTHLEEMVEQRTAELKAAQERLVRQEKLATLGQLIAVVGHELRNPLGTVRASLFTLGEKLRGTGVQVGETLVRAERNIVRCDTIIEDLLDYTRITVVEQIPTAVDIWLNEVLSEQVFSEGFRVVRDFRLAEHVAIDRERIRRCLINLISNACQALRDSGKPDGVITIRTFRDNNEAVIAVADNGPGIPAELQEKVFEPLFSTRNFGVGLGLTIVKQIVEQHAGRITIDSKVGHGTEAAIRLKLS